MTRPVSLAAYALLAGLMLVELTASSYATATPLGVAVVLLTASPALLCVRRPALALGLGLASLWVVCLATGIYQTIAFPSVLAGYVLATRVPWRRSLLAGALTAPVVVGLISTHGSEKLLSWELPKNLALIALPLVLGVAVRHWRAYTRALHERAETAERTREEEALRRVGEERLRIARDVHDVVAHAMVAINVQAGVGARLAHRDPAQAESALADIKRVSGEALGDLRTILGVLREDGAALEPVGSLDDVHHLGERLRGAGLDLHLDLAHGSVPAVVDATGYRIVQESLTNVLRHAGPTTARVLVRREADRLVIDVTDDGGASGAEPGSGNGVRGMRERVLALGGAFEAGPRTDGGWRVAASLPVGVA